MTRPPRSLGGWTARLCATALCVVVSTSAVGAPLDTCPARAFLSQNANATLYSINLVTGHYDLLENNMGAGKINAVGFSVHDRYFYAWSYQHDSLARFGDDYQIESLNMQNISDRGFFVGDVAVHENAYYAYRRGAAHGLYRVSLDPITDDHLLMTRVIDGSSLDLKIFDFAFHPSNQNAYAIDKNGLLWEIDVSSGSANQLGNVGQTGTFGAAYFDVDGRLYFSRNNDGNIFFVDIDNQNYLAQLFAIGPASSTNDGARCALAPVVDDSDTAIDFGDAPASYGTYLADNGARHGIPETPTLFLGLELDGESDASPAPLSDDEVDLNDDEDGVQFATNVRPGGTAIVLVRASEAGNLNAWIDFDQSGTFEISEQIALDRALNAGVNFVAVSVPSAAQIGTTWGRFRLSTSSGVGATGGVADGEVEDEQIFVVEPDSAETWYPSPAGWTTVAYEDNWPLEADYDMNDLVLFLRTGVYRSNDEVNLVYIKGQVAAVGAAFQNGFAIRLPGIPASAIDEDNVSLVINGANITRTILESGVSDASFIIAYNVFNHVSPGEDCDFYRSEPGCGGNVEMTFELLVPLATATESDLAGVFDPFLFATPGAWHGEHFASPPGRSYEIHLKNQAPTEMLDPSFLGWQLDVSDPSAGRYYQNARGLPWALEVPDQWKYPREFMDLLWAYPEFEGFVESNAGENQDWYLEENADTFFIFDK